MLCDRKQKLHCLWQIQQNHNDLDLLSVRPVRTEQLGSACICYATAGTQMMAFNQPWSDVALSCYHCNSKSYAVFCFCLCKAVRQIDASHWQACLLLV